MKLCIRKDKECIHNAISLLMKIQETRAVKVYGRQNRLAIEQISNLRHIYESQSESLLRLSAVP